MKIKWTFCLLSGLSFLSMVACQSAGIICRPSSAMGGSSGENGIITIAWDPNTESDLGGYRVFYGTSQGKYENCVDVGTATESSPGVMQYTLTNLVRGKRYYIAIIAYSTAFSTSGFSKEVSGVAK